MKNVVLVLSTSMTPEGALDLAVREAKDHGARLYALYIVEPGIQKEVFDLFSDIGFIGDKPSMELTEALMKEHRQRGYEEVGRVQVKAMEAAVDFEPLTEHGDYLTVVLELVENLNIDLVVAVRKKQSGLRGYFSRSPVDELVDRAPCKVELVDEE